MIPKSHVIVIEEPNFNLFTGLNLVLAFHDIRVRDIAGVKFPESIMEFKHDYVRWSIGKDNWHEIGQGLMERLKTGEHDPDMIYAKTVQAAESVMEVLDTLSIPRLSEMSNHEMLAVLNIIWERACELHFWGVIPVATDMEHFTLSSALQQAAEQKIASLHLDIPAAECVSILTAPREETIAMKERQIVLDMAKEVRQRDSLAKNPSQVDQVIKNDPHLHHGLDTLVDQFCWLHYGYQGPARGREQFVELIARLLTKEIVDLELEELRTRADTLQQKQQSLIAKLELTEWEQRLFSTAAKYTYLKGLRVDVRSRTNYWYDLMFTELTKRFQGLTITDLRYSTIDEVRSLLAAGRMPTTVEERRARREWSIFYLEESGRGIILGQKGQDLFDQTVADEAFTEPIDEISGQVASPGLARGTVKIIFGISDLGKVEHRDILVANATNPDYLPAMYKASAFVTDHGGITSHAAIVAREMHKPCIIGTRLATKTLKDGDTVEVDAQHGIVRVLKRS